MNPPNIPLRDLPSRYVAIVWQESAVEYQGGEIQKTRLHQTIYITSSTLGGLFRSIKDHRSEIEAPPASQPIEP